MAVTESTPNPPEDHFTDTIERILSAAEGREGHLIDQDLDALTQLCTYQASLRSLNGPLGFADVDVSWTGQLMEGLQLLVAMASSIDFVQAGCQCIQAGKEDGGGEVDTIETVCIIYDTRRVGYWFERLVDLPCLTQISPRCSIHSGCKHKAGPWPRNFPWA
jgi:hypothetical protein